MAQGSVKQGNHRGRRTLIGLSNNRGPLLGRRSADGRSESTAGIEQDDSHERPLALRRGESRRILPPDSCRTSIMNDTTDTTGAD